MNSKKHGKAKISIGHTSKGAKDPPYMRDEFWRKPCNHFWKEENHNTSKYEEEFEFIRRLRL